MKYDRFENKTYTIEEIEKQMKSLVLEKLSEIGEGAKTHIKRKYTIEIDNNEIYLLSDRYLTFFTKGYECPCCGLKATHFALERSGKAKRYHLNLYGSFGNEEVLFTKDHIVPKSRDGKDEMSNYQTMCLKCNNKKGASVEMSPLEKDLALAKEIAKKVDEKGGHAYLVGGYVRDKMLGLENKDIDIEVHGVDVDVLRGILKSLGTLKEFGKSFGVFQLEGYGLDISLPRTEISTGNKHTDFTVVIDPMMGLEAAASRRDFTINAMMEDVLTGFVLDFFGGIKDIEEKVIRHVSSKTFVEDPLRVFRACQFAARFGFYIAPQTRGLCCGMELKSLAKERVFEELKKALLKSEKPSIFFREYLTITHSRENYWFTFLDTFQKNGTLSEFSATIDNAAQNIINSENPLEFMLTASMMKLINSPMDELNSVEKALKKVTNDNKIIKYVLRQVKALSWFDEMELYKATFYEINENLSKTPCKKDFALLKCCDSENRVSFKDNLNYLEGKIAIFDELMTKPHVTGNDLIAAGLQPNKNFSNLLKSAHYFRMGGYSKERTLEIILKKLGDYEWH